jgi:putative flippase GtrA
MVGGIGALIQLGLTLLLRNILESRITKVSTISILGHKFKIEYYLVLSLCIAIGVALIWNFTLNLRWTFK